MGMEPLSLFYILTHVQMREHEINETEKNTACKKPHKRRDPDDQSHLFG